MRSMLFRILMQTGGQSLIELLLAVGVTAVLIPILIGGLITSREGKVQKDLRLQAIGYMKESQEAIRSIREEGWTNIATNGTFYPRKQSDNSWELVSGSQTINGTFSRTVMIEDVYRNPTGTIVLAPTPGVDTVDPSTKKITSSVSWGGALPSSVSSPLYLTRFLENNTYTETTEDDFNFVASTNPGLHTGTTVRSTSPPGVPGDGEVILGAGGNGNWCAPNLSGQKINLTGGVADSVVAEEGKAYVGTGQNQSGLPFIQIGLSNTPPYPQIPQQLGTSTLNYKSNAVWGEGNVGYFATDTNAKEVVMIDLSAAPPYPEIGFFNAPNNGNGTSLYMTSTYGYVTSSSGNKLYNFRKYGDTTSPIDADGVTLSGVPVKVVVFQDYAYVAVANEAYQMDIINISNPSNLLKVGQFQASFGTIGRDVYITSNDRAYLVTRNSASAPEFHIVNITTKTSPQLVAGGTWDTSPMDPQGVVIVPGNNAIIVGSGGIAGKEQYQVLNISNESAPTKCGGLLTAFNINGIAAVSEGDHDVFSYLVTSDPEGEFKIIEGGPGGTFATSGIFESKTFDPNITTANNRFTPTYSQPAGTTMRFQVSMANKAGGNCPTTGNYTFVGPDGTSGTYFTPSSGAPITFPFTTFLSYINPGECIRYRAYLDTSVVTSTPVLNDITINYSP